MGSSTRNWVQLKLSELHVAHLSSFTYLTLKVKQNAGAVLSNQNVSLNKILPYLLIQRKISNVDLNDVVSVEYSVCQKHVYSRKRDCESIS